MPSRGITIAGVIAATALAIALVEASSAPAKDRTMQFSGHCPIDVIFPVWVDAERAREFVPRGYEIATEPAGKSMIIVSLVACEDTVVDGLTRGDALYSDLLFLVSPPAGSGTPLVDRFFDGYWAWVVTDEPVVHAGLSRMGMFHGFDPDMSVSATRIGDRVVAVDGEVKWAQSPFRLHADVLDLAPAGWPAYTNYFWQDVSDGRMLAKLHKRAGAAGYGEGARVAQFTLTTRSGSRLGRLLGCAAGAEDCSVSGAGIVTELPRFEYDISVQDSGDRTVPHGSKRGRPRLSVRPRSVTVGKRQRFRFRATIAEGGRRVPVRGATIRFAGRRARTDDHGQAAIAIRLRRPGRYRAKLISAAGQTSAVMVHARRSGLHR